MNISTGDPGDHPDWDPCAAAFATDQVRAFDELRQRCPVAHRPTYGWSLLRHADVLRAVTDPAVFSSRVSTHVAAPNGMDPPEHTAYREVVDRCFQPDEVAGFEPVAQRLAADLIDRALADGPVVDVMAGVAEPFAAQAQCAYLGWPDEMGEALLTWAAESAAATAAGDRAELDRVAADFDRIISAELARAGSSSATAAPQGSSTPQLRRQAPPSITERLVRERVDGRPISHTDVVSMMRNWTAGELATIAAAVGIVVAFLGDHPHVRAILRKQPDLRQRAIDEMLRLDAPLTMNRRRTTTPVTLGGRTIPAEAKTTVVWPAAQRDPEAFDHPAEFRLDRDPDLNLLYGRGPHSCPGEGLARVELGAFLAEWLDRVPSYEVHDRVRASYPSGGFSRVAVEWAAS